MLRMRLIFVLLIILLLPSAAAAAALAGKTTIQSEAVAGMEVFAYPGTTLDFSSPAPYKAGPTGDDGLFH